MKRSTTFLISTALIALAGCNASISHSDGTTTIFTNVSTSNASFTAASSTTSFGSTGSNSTASIVGLWDFSFNLSIGVRDVYYVQYFDNGTATIYDYQGDTADQGENCYLISTETIENLGNNNYSNGVQTFGARREGSGLSYSHESTTRPIPTLVGLSPTDFNRCS